MKGERRLPPRTHLPEGVGLTFTEGQSLSQLSPVRERGEVTFGRLDCGGSSSRRNTRTTTRHESQLVTKKGMEEVQESPVVKKGQSG